MRIACPHCGDRDAREFVTHGDAGPIRPDAAAPDALARFVDYVYLRDNPAGALRELWFHAAGWIAGFVLFGVACILAWRFVNAPELADMLRWGAASALAFMGVALVKVWFWLELQKNAIVREVKRLELQVASLAAQLRRP